MMKQVLVLLTITIALTSSCGDDTCDKVDKTYDAVVYNNQSLKLVWDTVSADYHLGGFVSSENSILALDHQGENCLLIDDDEWGEVLYIEVPEGVTDFSKKDKGLTEMLVVYHEVGAWITSELTFVEQGTIIGERLSASFWQLDIDVRLPKPNAQGRTNFSYSGIFRGQ